jgi:hypothetical protein
MIAVPQRIRRPSRQIRTCRVRRGGRAFDGNAEGDPHIGAVRRFLVKLERRLEERLYGEFDFRSVTTTVSWHCYCKGPALGVNAGLFVCVVHQSSCERVRSDQQREHP